MTQGFAAVFVGLGFLALALLFLGGAESAFQETVVTTGATAFFALAVAVLMSAVLTELKNAVSILFRISGLLIALDERDKKFKSWQLRQARSAEENVPNFEEFQQEQGRRLR